MIIRFSENRVRQIFGIIRYNYKAILLFVFIDFIIFIGYTQFGLNIHLPAIPVSILGGALAIFLGFRNNSAYDRWWEARKIWGGIVNISRSFASEVSAILESNSDKKRFVYRHLAWINALRIQLRKQNDFSDLQPFLSQEEWSESSNWKNKATQLVKIQMAEMAALKRSGAISDFEQKQIMESLKTMYDYQGMAERIKNTVFPYYYVYFTHLVLWTFIVLLPCILIEDMGWSSIPMSALISFVFYILDKSGLGTEDPFENRAADTPMTALCKTIEIDLRQILNEKELSDPYPVQESKVGVKFLK
jgi:putative membrane protein